MPPGLPPSTFVQASNYLSTRFQGKTIAEAARIGLRIPAVRTVLIVTVLMNVFGFSYTAVVPAWGEQVFGATPTMGSAATKLPTGSSPRVSTGDRSTSTATTSAAPQPIA